MFFKLLHFLKSKIYKANERCNSHNLILSNSTQKKIKKNS